MARFNEYNYIQNIKGDEFANMYKALANHYLRRFCLRCGFNYYEAGWVEGKYGGVAMVNGMLIGFDDLRYAVENQIPWEVFKEWYDYDKRVADLEQQIRKGEKFTTLLRIGLRPFAAGEPAPYSADELKMMEDGARDNK